MQELYEPEEAELPVGVPDPVLEDDMEGHRRAEAEFLMDQRRHGDQ